MPVDIENNKSAQPGSPLYGPATQQILAEIEHGNYEVCDSKPPLISPFSVIEKPDGGVRLIHDGSQPEGASMNDYATLDMHHRFQSVDDATRLLWPGYYMAKVDLKSAYRSVAISEHSQQFTGLKWQFGTETVFLRDKKLPFGSKLAPGIFHRLTQSVRRMMAKRFPQASLVVYLDDFLLLAPSASVCQAAQATLLKLLRTLGFQISWTKVIDPAQRIIFLGIELDSLDMCLRLPSAKLHQLRQELADFSQRRRATKRQLQSLTGKLNWAAAVVFGGRVFLRRIINLTNTLRNKTDRVLLSKDMRRDIDWWLQFMSTFNGKSAMLDKEPITTVYTDACNAGCGGVFGSDWFYCNWDLDWPAVSSLHINYKECLAVVVAAARWAPLWAGKRIYLLSDNQAAVGMLNRGTAKQSQVMECLRWLFWLSATHGFHLTARYIPGSTNVAADSASRILEPGQGARLANHLPAPLFGSLPPPYQLQHITDRVLNYCCRAKHSSVHR